jgi:hypothetical protein
VEGILLCAASAAVLVGLSALVEAARLRRGGTGRRQDGASTGGSPDVPKTGRRQRLWVLATLNRVSGQPICIGGNENARYA